MAGKPKPMGQIKQLLLLHSQQKGIKTIARMLGMSKNTVKAYIAKLHTLTSGQDGKVFAVPGGPGEPGIGGEIPSREPRLQGRSIRGFLRDRYLTCWQNCKR